MDWHPHITSDPTILNGRPVVRGTRLAVDFVMGLFAAGWSHEQVLSSYPNLTGEALQAIFSFATEVLHEESVYAPLHAGR